MIIYTNTRYKPKRKSKKTVARVGTYKAEFKQLKPTTPLVELRNSHPSLSTLTNDTSRKETIPYTGNKLIGISIIHKSCLQPVFSQEEATDAAHMRR